MPVCTECINSSAAVVRSACRIPTWAAGRLAAANSHDFDVGTGSEVRLTGGVTGALKSYRCPGFLRWGKHDKNTRLRDLVSGHSDNT